MTSNARRAESELTHLWSDYAQKLISDGYRRINSYFEAAKKRDGHADGTFLKEVIDKLPSLPSLLTAEEFDRFRRSEGLYESEDIIGVICSILRDVCGEKQLLPSITIDAKSRKIIVILRK